jgi:WD40 repeat protein
VISAVALDGGTLYTAALDGKVLIWDLAGDRRVGRPFDIAPGLPQGYDTPPLASHALSADGRTLAVGHGDGTVSVIDARTLRERSRFRTGSDAPLYGMAFIPGGPLLAVGGAEGFLGVFDPRTGDLVDELADHSFPMRMPTFSADGRLMATASADLLQLSTLSAGRPAGTPRQWQAPPGGIIDAAISPDGRTVAVASNVGVDMLDVATLQTRKTLDQTVMSLTFSPDGRFLVLGGAEGWAQLVSTETWRPVSRRMAGHTAEVTSIAVSPDGQILATGGWEGTVRLFDMATGQALGGPLQGVPNRTLEPRFTPDGFLFTVSDSGMAYRWDLRPSSWARHACAVAGRKLTRAEWNEVLPGRPYAPACG